MREFRQFSEALCTSTWGPRRPQVPLLGLQVLQLGPSRPILGPKRRPRGLPGRFWSNFGPLGEALEAQKRCKIIVFAIFHVAPQASSRSSNPKRPPRGAQERPGTPQERPKRPQDGSKSAKSVPVLHPPGVDFRPVFFSRKALPQLSGGQSLRKPTPSTALPPCVTSTCRLVRRRTANQ